MSTDRDTRKLGAGRKLDPLITGSPSARVYSVERTGQLLATHPSAGNWLEAALWKPGRKDPLAVLKNDAPAMALLRRIPSGTVRECRSLFCVASMNLVVTQEQQRVTIWHADPANQNAEAVARAEVKVPPPAVEPPAAKAPVGPAGTVPQMVSRANRSVLVPPGLPMTYRVRVSAVQDFPVKFEIAKGPEGLKIDGEGNVTWASPVGGEGTEYDVVVRMYNEEKKLELLDPWKLRITTAPPKRP